MEHSCWVCNSPIDPAKSSKPFEKKEEKLDLEMSKEPSKDLKES